MPTKFSFVPHAATNIGSLVGPPVSGGGRLRLDLNIAIDAGGGSVSAASELSGELRGPGDILSVSSSMIARVEPINGLRGFEPNYMPFVEFRDADFPWRYAIEPGDSKGRRKPWLQLIALKTNEYEVIERGSAPLSRIRVFSVRESLPDLKHSWAHAHVQLSLGEKGTANSEVVLENNPEDSHARLICSRKLKPKTGYTLFLVPAYETGRLTGLGIPIQLDGANAYKQPAWSVNASQMTVDLPVYQQWRFVTDEQEDLELLMRRLKPVAAADLGKIGFGQIVSTDNPGHYRDYMGVNQSFKLQGSLVGLDEPAPKNSTHPTLQKKMVDTLNQVIKSEFDDADEDEDPLVTFPAYGSRFRPETDVSIADADNHRWFDRINLDLQYRNAAALGAQVVYENQEEFSHDCWKQYDEVVAANEKLAALQLADRIAGIYIDKHLKKMAPEVVMALSEPILPFVAVNKASVVNNLRSNGVPTSFASRALRRQAAKRPVRSSAVSGSKVIPAPGLPGDTQRSDRLKAETRLGNAPVNTALQPNGLGDAVKLAFSAGVGVEIFDGVKRLKAQQAPIKSYSSTTLVNAVARTLEKLPAAKSKFTIDGLSIDERKAINPVWRTPRITTSMADKLKDYDRDRLLNNVSNLPANSISFFDENRSFLEAFMVGANHAMNEELRWREFPTDLRGTVFKHFWNRGHNAHPNSPSDIKDIHTWRGKLGLHPPNTDADGEKNVVIVIRGDVVRKLGDPILELNIASGKKFKPNAGEQHEPIFSGKLGTEIAYFGFDISLKKLQQEPDKTFFVIYEPLGRLRFGLDVANTRVRKERRDMSTQYYGFKVGTVDRLVSPQAPDNNLISAAVSPPPVSSLTKWDDFSWQHVQLNDADYIDFSKNITVRSEPAYWSAAKNSAGIARSFLQKPLAAYMSIKRVF